MFVVFELKIMRKTIYKKVWDAIDFLAVTMQSHILGTFNDLIVWNWRLFSSFKTCRLLVSRIIGKRKKNEVSRFPFPSHQRKDFPCFMSTARDYQSFSPGRTSFCKKLQKCIENEGVLGDFSWTFISDSVPFLHILRVNEYIDLSSPDLSPRPVLPVPISAIVKTCRFSERFQIPTQCWVCFPYWFSLMIKATSDSI